MRKPRTFGDMPSAGAELVAEREAALRAGPPAQMREALEGLLVHLPAGVAHVALSAWRAASAAYEDDAAMVARRKALEKQRRAVARIRAELKVAIGGPDLSERDDLIDQVMAAQTAGRWAQAAPLLDRANAISAATPPYIMAYDQAVRRRGPMPPPPLADALDALDRVDLSFAKIADGLRGGGPPVTRLAHFGRVLFPIWIELRRRETTTPARDLRAFLSAMAETATGAAPSERLIDTVGDQLRRTDRLSSHN